MKAFDITALGEILIDFTPVTSQYTNSQLYEQNPGGAPANTACAAARLGAKCAFLGKTGSDEFGRACFHTLAQCGVETSGMRTDKTKPTTLAFVTLTESGERSFSFYRTHCADTNLTSQELDSSILKNTSILHVGSLSLTDEPSRSATFDAVNIVKKAGGKISYDPNWRAALWQSCTEGIRAMKSLLPFADIIKVSEEELPLLASNTFSASPLSQDELSRGAEELMKHGAQLVCITLGSRGVFYKARFASFAAEGTVPVPSIKTHVVDTTGAGDCFIGAVLSQISRHQPNSVPELEQILLFANAAASICILRRGGIPAMPNSEEVLELL